MKAWVEHLENPTFSSRARPDLIWHKTTEISKHSCLSQTPRFSADSSDSSLGEATRGQLSLTLWTGIRLF